MVGGFAKKADRFFGTLLSAAVNAAFKEIACIHPYN
jgi:hypothetical protein